MSNKPDALSESREFPKYAYSAIIEHTYTTANNAFFRVCLRPFNPMAYTTSPVKNQTTVSGEPVSRLAWKLKTAPPRAKIYA